MNRLWKALTIAVLLSAMTAPLTALPASGARGVARPAAAHLESSGGILQSLLEALGRLVPIFAPDDASSNPNGPNQNGNPQNPPPTTVIPAIGSSLDPDGNGNGNGNGNGHP